MGDPVLPIEILTRRVAPYVYTAAGVGLTVYGARYLSADSDIGIATGAWLEICILLFISAFLLEPHFTGGGAAATNAVATTLIILSLRPTAHTAWWDALGWLALAGFTVNIGAHVMRPTNGSPPRGWLVRRAHRAGSWSALLVPLLILTAVTFNRPFGSEWALCGAALVYVFTITSVRPLERIGDLLARNKPEQRRVLGIFPPNELIIEAGSGPIGTAGTVALRSTWAEVEAMVVHDSAQAGIRSWRLIVPSLRELLPPNESHETLANVAVSDVDAVNPMLAETRQALSEEGGAQIVGVASDGTSIEKLIVDLGASSSLRVGDVVWTWSVDGRCYWQTVDIATRHAAWTGGPRQILTARMTQLGLWQPQRAGFRLQTAAPPVNAPAVSGGVVAEAELEAAGVVRIGEIPGSAFPVAVDAVAIGRQHAAVLGTTGTGKTHLAFILANALRDSGTNVVCVDQTGQYAARFAGVPALSTLDEVKEFVEGGGEFCTVTPDGPPIIYLNSLARRFYQYTKAMGALAANAPARWVIIVDEAHNYVPEFFVLDNNALKAKVQDTAKVLMESRKYGLGFVIISQRTAMVTKSALSQCNTIFAFISVDQTGIDYLEGMCGRELASTVPRLPHRTAILMGQASASSTPVIGLVDSDEFAVD